MNFKEWLALSEEGDPGLTHGNASKRPWKMAKGQMQMPKVKLTPKIKSPNSLWVDDLPRPEDIKFKSGDEERDMKLPSMKVSRIAPPRPPVKKHRQIPKPEL